MIELYTDGSCLENPGGKGSYAYIVVKDDIEIDRNTEVFRSSTNNRMEMVACIEGLKSLLDKPSCKISVKSDSKYLIDGINSWIWKWMKNGWKTRNGNVLNKDLWLSILELVKEFKDIGFYHVNGHAGIKWNELCDELAYQSLFNKDISINEDEEYELLQKSNIVDEESELNEQMELDIYRDNT